MKINKQYYLFFQFFLVLFCYTTSFFTIGTSNNNWNAQEVVVIKAKKEIDKKPIFRQIHVAPNLKHNKNHVSSITFLKNNTLLCTWYAGSREGASDVSIYGAIYKNNTWATPKVIMNLSKCSLETKRYIRKVGNAVVFKDNNDVLWMFYCSIAVGGWAMSNINCIYSKDDGETWSISQRLILSPFINLSHNVKNKPILLKNGSFLLPIYQEFVKKYALVLWGQLKNNRFHYQIRRITFSKKCLQPSFLYLGNNKISAYFRNRHKGQILTNTSTDLGLNWSTVTESKLPNPNSGFDLLTINQKTHLGIINYSKTERDNLVIVMTNDYGKNWEKIYFLEKPIPLEQDERYQKIGKKQHYYQYASIISNASDFHITYTAFNKIKHIYFNRKWLNMREKLDD